MFSFCDDGVTTVYRSPWWFLWEQELSEVFKSLDVDPERVIRCVMARLPGQTNIPVHHDTGHWVTCSHRIHVALKTSKLIMSSSATSTG